MLFRSKEAQYSIYKTTSKWKSNRERRLLKLLASQPNNKEIEKAIKNLSYRRAIPKTKMWSKSNKRMAQLIKSFAGSCPHAVFSSNTKLAESTLASIRTTYDKHKPIDGKVSFKLGDRVFTKETN